MCFSVEADIAVGVGLLPVAAVALREVRHPREIPFAALLLLFAAHQLIEVLVWEVSTGRSARGCVTAPRWPTS